MVSPKNRTILWARAAGRCQYSNCNELLIGDLISGKAELNASYVAHIVAEAPDGPRGDTVRSPLLADDIRNLMLLCDRHHRLIDREALLEHPEALLLAMKARHESRLERVTGISEDRSSQIVLFGARIGEHDYPVRVDLAMAAMLPNRFPAEWEPVRLDMARLDYDDAEASYWRTHIDNLRRQFERKVVDRLRTGDISHISLFALAPQPLLIELGRLFSDIANVAVFQLHREPQDWRWRQDREPVQYITRDTAAAGPVVALKLALSATIADPRVHAVLGSGIPIWELTVPTPHNDMMNSEADLVAFRMALRTVLDRIKARNGEEATIHVFPALPVSAAIEVGRVWMPKADLPLVIYDQRREAGFVPRTMVGEPRVAVAMKEATNA